jgi:hypothetical protein
LLFLILLLVLFCLLETLLCLASPTPLLSIQNNQNQPNQTQPKTNHSRNVLGEESSDSVTVSFFGDGTCNVGQFYESLNMAALYKLPHIFVVENNKWAIGMSHGRATSRTLGDEDPYIYKKGPAFGMPGVHVDGMDALKVREVAQEAIARARRGDGPTLIEAETYRFRGHSLADPDELRSKEEKAKYAARDPIPQVRLLSFVFACMHGGIGCVACAWGEVLFACMGEFLCFA